MNKRLLIIYRGCGSVRVTIFLFTVLALALILGTIVPQGLFPEKYASLYSPKVYALLTYLDIFDMYHSWWFTALLISLSANILVCTVTQIHRISRLYMFPQDKFDDTIFRSSASSNKRFFSNKEMPDLKERFNSLLKSLMGCNALCIEKSDGIYLFAERGRWSRFGMVFVHCSILFILCGGLIAAIGGFTGHMNLVEGQQSNRVILSGNRGSLLLDFDVRCEDFTVGFYENGLPREYLSALSILEGGKSVLSTQIRVNHPLFYKGVKFYQASFGTAGASYAIIDAKNQKTGEEVTLKTGAMQKSSLPGSESYLAIGTFDTNYQGGGPSVLGVLIEKGKPHKIFWISKEGVIEKSETDDFFFRLKDVKIQYYTGLMVTNNPGTPLIWIGFVLFFSGFIINLFFSHKRIWVRMSPLEKGCKIDIATSASKRKEVFKERLDVSLEEFDWGNKF